MARIATRPADEQEDELLDELAEEAEESVASSGPVVSDSRRRRMLKRGETLPEATATPARKEKTATREVAVATGGGNFITRAIGRLRNYFTDTVAELRKVSWPTREEALRLTWIVIIFTIVTALVLGFVSFLFSLLTAQVANPATSTLFGIITIALIAIVALGWLFRDRLPGSGSIE